MSLKRNSNRSSNVQTFERRTMLGFTKLFFSTLMFDKPCEGSFSQGNAEASFHGISEFKNGGPIRTKEGPTLNVLKVDCN